MDETKGKRGKERSVEKGYQDWRDNPTIRPWHPDRLNARSEFTISEDENDLNKPWRYRGGRIDGHAYKPVVPPGLLIR